MIPILSLLTTLAISLIVTRVGTMALMLTGMSREMARFQARSAFTGVGFTTDESEGITNHPVRRQVVMLLMLLGNAGIVTAVATLMASLANTSQSGQWWPNIGFLAAGIVVLWLLAISRFIERRLNKVISWGLRFWTRMEVRDYIALLQLRDGFAVTELTIAKSDWLANKSLIDLRLPHEGVLILGIQRPHIGYIGAPTAKSIVEVGDTLILYGPIRRLEELDQRRSGRSGDEAHQEAIEENERLLEEQKELVEPPTATTDTPNP